MFITSILISCQSQKDYLEVFNKVWSETIDDCVKEYSSNQGVSLEIKPSVYLNKACSSLGYRDYKELRMKASLLIGPYNFAENEHKMTLLLDERLNETRLNYNIPEPTVVAKNQLITLIDSANKIVVRSGSPSSLYGHPYFIETSQSIIDRLISEIDFDSSTPWCDCPGDLCLDFYKGDKLLASVQYIHLKVLTWKPFRYTCFTPSKKTIEYLKIWLNNNKDKFNEDKENSIKNPDPILKSIIKWIE